MLGAPSIGARSLLRKFLQCCSSALANCPRRSVILGLMLAAVVQGVARVALARERSRLDSQTLNAKCR